MVNICLLAGPGQEASRPFGFDLSDTPQFYRRGAAGLNVGFARQLPGADALGRINWTTF